MKFPDFNDFLKTLTPEKINELCSKEGMNTEVVYSPLKDSSLDLSKIVAPAFLFSINLIGEYHQWLSKWFESNHDLQP